MLVSCVAYQDGLKVADIQSGEISTYISRPECFVWVALKDPEPGELEAMQLSTFLRLRLRQAGATPLPTHGNSLAWSLA